MIDFMNDKTTVDATAAGATYVPYPIKGVILKVYPADSDANAAFAELGELRSVCSVFVTFGGPKVQVGKILPYVAITSGNPLGAPSENWDEFPPKGLSDVDLASRIELQGFRDNPLLLDGDQVIVSFLGGFFNMPFITRYWPHSANNEDVPYSQGNDGETPTQRRFIRTNKTEFTISDLGDVTFDTSQSDAGNIDINLSPEKTVIVSFGGTQMFRVTTSGEDVLVDMGTAGASAIVGEAMRDIFDAHTHPTAVGPSGPPMATPVVTQYFEPPIPPAAPFLVPTPEGQEEFGTKPKDILLLAKRGVPGLMSLCDDVLSNKIRIPFNS